MSGEEKALTPSADFAAFVPTATMPGPVRAFAEHQPLTSIVNAIRDLFTQQPVGATSWIALAWCVAILILAYTFAMVIYRRRIAWCAERSGSAPCRRLGGRLCRAGRGVVRG